MEIWKTPDKKPRRPRTAVALFLALGVCVLVFVAASQRQAASRAKAVMDSAAVLADAILDLGEEGPAQIRNLAWEVSRVLRVGANEGALGMAELERIKGLVLEARANATAETRRQTLEQIARIVEGPAAPPP